MGDLERRYARVRDVFERALVTFAKQHAMTPSQVALAWLLAQDGVIAIPKTGHRERVRDNAAALEHRQGLVDGPNLVELVPETGIFSPL